MAKLGKAFPLIRNGASIKQTDGAGGYPITRIETIANREVDRSKFGYADINDLGKYEDYLLHDGDILMSHINSEKHLGKVALYRSSGDEHILHGMNLLMLRADTQIVLPSYAAYFFNSDAFLRQIPSITKKSVNQASFTVTALKELNIPLPSLEDQVGIVKILDMVGNLISLRKQQLAKLDELVKSRFVELFGDPITNSKRLPTERMELRFNLKAGITTAADDIHDFEKGRYEIPCYGGNGIRGYVKEKSYEGNFPIIGRQGALCGNVQYATGKFHATEHAVLVSLLKDDNEVWVYYLLKLMDLYRYHTGAAQPGLSVKTLNTVDVIVADKCLQDQFAAFVKQTDKSKVAVQKALDEAQLLFDSLMQKYFG